MWAASLINLSVAGLLAAAFALMAFGMDPSDIVTEGAEPWSNAALAAAAFAGLVVVTVLSLWFWHTRRWRPIALAMTVAEIGCVAWVSVTVYAEYF